MCLFPRLSRALGLSLLLLFVTFQAASGQGKSDPVNFETTDGVKIQGTFWPSTKGKKAPVVMLLHDFKAGKGGNSGEAGWKSLAEALNKLDYAVLSFDFRGHGESTTVNPLQFWMNPQNRAANRGAQPNPLKPPETIGQGNFLPHYYTMLVNDVTAARSFLDRKNDGGELNTSNLIVIGAGEGASIGALWLATEFHMKRGIPQVMGVGTPILDARFIKFDPAYEGKDVVAAVWLGISPTIAGRNVPVRGWITESAKTNKVPTAFIFGKEDRPADQYALTLLQSIIPGYERTKKVVPEGYALTGEFGIDKTKLAGSQLLQKDMKTEELITSSYLSPVMEKHQIAEWRDRESTKSQYYWLFPQSPNPAVPPIVVPAKNMNDLAPQLVPLNRFGLIN